MNFKSNINKNKTRTKYMYKNYDIPNRIKQSSQCCIYCGKPYKTRIKLDKHMTFCELIYKTTKNRKEFIIEDDETEIPSQKKLYKAILALTRRFINLEEKVDEMNQFIVKRKKRINIIDWLNTNIIPDIMFTQLIDKIIVNEKDIDYLFKNTVQDTYNQIFDRTLYMLKNSEKSTPLFSFIHKTNVLYIYDLCQEEQLQNTNESNNESNNENNDNKNEDKKEQFVAKWHELTRDKLITFLYNVHNKISRQLYYWKQQRNYEIKRDDKLATEYDKTILKLMLTDFKKESIFLKFKHCIYQHMKIDMKGLIEYEFDY